MKLIRVILFSLLLLAQQTVSAAESLTVAVAANVKFAFDDLAAAFTADTGIEVKPVYSSSGKIVSQVREGAPYDVFLSADMEYPQKLYKDGQAVTVPRVYAYGKLVLWTLKDGLDLSKGLAVLADAEVRKIAVANPRVAPYGAEALKAVDRLGIRPAIEAKLVYAENIAQVVQYVDSGNVEAGFTAKSLVTAPEQAGRGKWIDVPPEAYDPIAQGAVILRYGQVNHGDAARKFYGFLYSPKARAVLEKFHYGLP
ncbi:Molybdate-binding protein ModA [Methylophilaceae bacterium]|nr:Molybdate-binding protein ModA [Methylophilaceae bacterium]